MKFEEHLVFLIKDRKKTPWGKSLGFTSPSITAMFNGHTPGPEFLNAMRRAENVNLNWLLTGEGSPYIVEHFSTAEALRNHVCAMLQDEPWNGYVFAHHETACIILTQPGQYEFKGKWIDYSIIHVLVGPGDEALLNTLDDYNRHHGRLFIPDMAEQDKESLINGNIGTYQLLHQASPILTTDGALSDISELTFKSGTRLENPIDVSTMRAVVQLVDECEEKLNTKLNSNQRARVITAVYRQAERLELSEEDIQAAIETSFDVLSG